MTVISSLLALTLAVQPVQDRIEAGPPDAVVPRLEAAFDALEADGFSGVVAVTHNGEIIFEGGYGAANPETGAPFSIDTRVDMASIVKSFTGMVAAQMIEDGDLSPDLTLGEVFDDVPEDKAGITLHQLLTHSAGFAPAVASDEEQIGRDEMLERAFASSLRFEPGTDYDYSNTGFSIIAAIIEMRTGRSFEDVVIDDFLAPAGITQTGYTQVYDLGAPPEDMAYSAGRPLHDIVWGGHAPGWALIGNGGMVTTLRDLVAWRNAMNAGEIISVTALDRQQTGYVQEGAGAPSDYGYGVVVEEHPQFGRIVWHNGGNGYQSAYWGEYTDTGYAIFAATNQLAINADQAALAAVGAIFGVELRMAAGPDIEWAEPDFAAGPAEAMAGAWTAALLSGDAAQRQAFVETHMSDELRDFASMEDHLGMFDQVSELVAGRQPAGLHAGTDTIALRFEGEPPVTIEIGYEIVEGHAAITGLMLTD